ncbi:MAG: DNA polymerase III subunit beta [Erysipelotrichaceae bacterium]|nr:DNA polymerase III subunit beta [Erysipelotrichaceae bacterium]
MKFEISRTLLDNILQSVSKGLSNKTPLPILMGIQITAKDNLLTFITTNKEISVRVILESSNDLDIIEDGSCVVPGKYFVDIVKRIEGEKVEVTLFDQTTIKILSKNSDFTLRAYEKNNFPNTNFDLNTQPIVLKSKELKQIVKQTSFACASTEERIILTSINLTIKDNQLTVIATDSFRLARRTSSISSGFNSKIQINIPCKSLEEFSKILNDYNDDVNVYISNNQVLFKVANLSFMSRLVEGSYPDTSSLIPNDFLLSIKLNREELISVVNRASLFIDSENISFVKFSLSKNSNNIEISSNSTEIGRVVESLKPIEVSEEQDFQIAFSTKYLMDALKAFETQEIIMYFRGEIRPAIITSESNIELKQLLIPVRTF